MPEYLYEDDRGDIIISPLVTRRGEGRDRAGEWSCGYYYLLKVVDAEKVILDFQDSPGVTYESEEEAIRVTVQLAEECIVYKEEI